MIEDYKRDGVVVLRNVFMPGWGDSMDKRAAAWKAMPEAEYRMHARLFARGASQVRLFTSWPIIKAVMDLGIRDPIFLTDPATHVMGIDEKWDGVKAHQDFPALQSGLNTVVCWIPFTDVGLENWPVELAFGSHKLGLLPAKAGAHYSEIEADGLEFTPVPMRVGDVLLFSVFTAHRTRTPGTGFRLAVSHRFEDASDPWFVAHGGHSAQKKVIEREVKDTPTPAQVREVFA